MFSYAELGGSPWERVKDFWWEWGFLIFALLIVILRVWGIFWAVTTIASAHPEFGVPLVVLLLLTIGIDFNSKR